MKRTVRVFIFLLILWSVVLSPLTAEEGKLVSRVSLFNSDTPVRINSDRGWTQTFRVTTDKISPIPSQKEGSVRRWRIYVTYVNGNSSGASTLQLRLDTGNNNDPVFTLPWQEGKTDWLEHSSNWYMTQAEASRIIEEDAVCNMRLIAPPRSSAPGEIYQVYLEAWDFPDTGSMKETTTSRTGADMAFGPLLPHLEAVHKEPSKTRELNEIRQNGQKFWNKEIKEATGFSLSFVRSCLAGDKMNFFRVLDNTVYSLNSNQAISKFQAAPPEGSLEYNLADYKVRYNYTLKTYDEYMALFPEWGSSERDWNPDRDCYLFMGGELKAGKDPLPENRYFIFMVKKIDDKWKIVAQL